MQVEATTRLLDELGVAALVWRGAGYDGDTRTAEQALRRYYTAAARLIDLGTTFYDIDPMDCLPDELMPLVWQKAYAESSP